MPNNKNNTNDFSCKDSAFDYDEHAEEYKGSLCDFANNLWDKILQKSTYKYKEPNIDYDKYADLMWNEAMRDATNAYKPITDFLGVPEIYFSSKNETIEQASLEETLENCKANVPAKNNLFACTRQYGNAPDIEGSYEKPWSTIWFSNDWDECSLYDMFAHELEHQAIISTDQLLRNELNEKYKNNTEDSTYLACKDKLKYLVYLNEIDLDVQDFAYTDSITNRHNIIKTSNVYANELMNFVKNYDFYCR